MNQFNPTAALTRMAQDLTEIVRLYGELGEEAVAQGGRASMPGGDALNHLGPASLTDDWQARFDEAESAGDDVRYANDQTAERHVLIVLGDWSESVRRERRQQTGLRITVERAADYLRKSLPWIVEEFEDAPFLMAELAACRAGLEGLLRDGVRHDREATVCLRDAVDVDGELVPCGGQLERRTLERRDCEHAKIAVNAAKGALDPAVVLRRLLLNFPQMEREHRQCDQGGRDDVYRCARCNSLYDSTEYWNAVRAAYEKRAEHDRMGNAGTGGAVRSEAG